MGDAAAVTGSAVGDAVAVTGSAVGDAVVEVCAGIGVWLPAVAKAVGVREAVARLVAVATPSVGSSVGVGDGTALVGAGVSEGTPGGFVGAWVGGGAVGLLAVGVLVAPVGVIVGMVWFRQPALASSPPGAPQAASQIASVASRAKTTTRWLITPSLMIPLLLQRHGASTIELPAR